MRFQGTGRLPAFLGPTLRGGIGIHLKKAICHRPSSDCTSCMLRTSCLYCYLFDGVAPPERDIMRLYPNIPQPFVIKAGCGHVLEVKPGTVLSFGLTLFGKAADQFPYMLYSLIKLGKAGLGSERIPFELVEVRQPGVTEPVYTLDGHCIGRLRPRPLYLDVDGLDTNLLILEFVSPCRIRVDGTYARRPQFAEIVKATIRRLSIFQAFYGEPIPEFRQRALSLLDSTEVSLLQDQTHWYGFNRYSNRQARSIPMGGIVGRMAFGGQIGPFLGLLKAAEIVHLGKATSFGFGQIRVATDEAANGQGIA
ncbi:MAG: CRISPR system precrRNA processing endoribonuclease RAMP protein Cas6 [Sedimentisphaerales bacterium]|nr:CRISPR system precrRNA processing endoribonuclease RAMP protein Cas6 [Sedimentisphaerales bacterium]